MGMLVPLLLLQILGPCGMETSTYPDYYMYYTNQIMLFIDLKSTIL